ncbi:E3 ubiquitin-protein ligase RNF10-like [Ptychodera flava]|uniref:E3 ubiquitin-protein ligase RNF10-like n=1 Tax=Ptychodera flava TaxID=63121 RepID=UPI00396A41E8
MLEEGEEMEKKSATRQPSVTPPNKGANGDSKNKDGGRANNGTPKYNRRREQSFPRGEPNSARKPIPQKTKAIDKRPRSRNNNGGRREEVTKSQRAEFGSALSYGPKKINLNHLLNFTYSPREGSGSSGQSGLWKARNKWAHKRVRYNKEQFLQANCQFVVNGSGDYTVHAADPDILVDWELIEQVRIFSHDVPSCPICLYPPTAAKITRCGHIYCWTCILHYLSLTDKTWRKCPICYEAVHEGDLKSVVAMETHQYISGEKITMKLMKREKGSNIALPKGQWVHTEARPFHLGEESVDTSFVKLLVASPDQVQKQIIKCEIVALETKLADKDEESEVSFIKAAMESLKSREERLKSQDNDLKSLALGMEGVKIEPTPTDKEVKEDAAVKWVGQQDVVTYASAFDDEILPCVVDDEVTSGSPPADPASAATSDQASAANIDIPQMSNNQNDDDSLSTSVKSLDSTPGEPENAGVSYDGDVSEDRGSLLEESSHVTATAVETGHMYYFYQAEDGQHLYLHPINVRCLVKEYGSLEKCPETITANIIEIEGYSMTEDLRKRLRYLHHLPLTCEFGVCELKLTAPVISKDTIEAFSGDFLKRKKMRDKKAKDEKRRDKRIQIEEEKKSGKYPRPKLVLESNRQFPICGSHDAAASWISAGGIQPSSPSSVVSSGSDGSQYVFGSPTDSTLNPHAREFTPGSPPPPQPIVGSVDSVGSMESASSVGSPPDSHMPRPPSFADMLRAGKTKEAIPRRSSVPAKLGQPNPIQQLSPDSNDSDPEDFIPVPLYKDAFSDAIQSAMDKAALDTSAAEKADESANTSGGRKGKKGKKKQLLFSTSVFRYK